MVTSLAEVTLLGLDECGRRKSTLEDMINGHKCYDDVNMFDGQQVATDFAVLIFL